ncbi:MAG: FAD:protein FMN transferase [Candidatus Cryptobacteroides sp.]
MNSYFPTIRALAAALVCIFISGCTQAPEYALLRGYAQGGEYSVRYSRKGISADEETVRHAVDSILTLVDTTLSGYNKASILSRYNAGEEVCFNPLFLDVFKRCRDYYTLTGGALDVAAGPLFDAWGFGFRNSSLPSAGTVDSLRAVCGMDKLLPDLSPVSPEIEPVLNFNAVAQGYTCDLVAGYLHSLGVHDLLVDIGEIYCEGVNARGNFWKVGVDRPVDGNMTPGADLDGIWQGDGGGCGIVTSGNYRKYYEKDGKKYSHTIDPRTGCPVSHSLLSATIVAATAADADAYATYCMVIGLEEAKAFIASAPGIEGYLIYDEGGQMKEWASEGFNIVSPGR